MVVYGVGSGGVRVVVYDGGVWYWWLCIMIVCNETIVHDVWCILLYHCLQQIIKRHENNTSMILY